MERASFAKIFRLLEISQKERHHDVLLNVKNLHDLSRHPSPYSVPIIPCPLPSKVVEGEHIVAADLLSLILGGFSLTREVESEATGRELVISIQSFNLHLLARIPVLPPSARAGGGGWPFEASSIGNKGLSSYPPSVEEKEGEALES